MLAYLVMHRESDVARERLLETFWPEADPERGRDSLKTTLWAIRRTLRSAGLDADDFLLSTKSIVRWRADTVLDAQRFLELAKQDDPQSQNEAMQIYRGDFLEGDYDDWASDERARRVEVYETLLGRIVRTSKDAAIAQRLIDRNPYDEEAYATLISAELAAGKRGSAKALFDRCLAALHEVGTKPTPAFEERFADLALAPTAPDELALPFVGRQAELDVLRAALATDADRSAEAAIVLIHGEAGIGKSALLDKAEKLAAALGRRILAIGGVDEDPRMFGPWEAVYEEATGKDFDSFVRDQAGDIGGALADAIVAALSSPVAIILDDAHTLSGEALDIFIDIAKRAPPKHVVVIGTRPEGLALLRVRLADIQVTELLLGMLERPALEAALSQALGDQNGLLFEAIYARTAGHPLFFSGLLQSLVQDGVVAREGRTWKVVRALEPPLQLPSSLKNFMETRLRARGDDAQVVAGALALEPLATADDLVAVLDLGETRVFDALDDLLALSVITQPAEGPQFAFGHDLLREVALTTLNAGRRTSLHRAFAQRLEHSMDRDASLRRARHLRTSGQLIAAGESYAQAAREALAWGAVQDSAERASEGIRALEKIERAPRRDAVLASLTQLVSQAQMAAARPEAAVESAGDAVTLARSAGNSVQLARALVNRAVASGAIFNPPEQDADALEAAEAARAAGDDVLLAQALVQRAASSRTLGKCSSALEAAREAYDAAVRCADWDAGLAALEQQLTTQVTWWVFNDALQTIKLADDLGRRADAVARAGFLQARAMSWYALDRLEESEADLKLATSIAWDATKRLETEANRSIPLPQLRFTSAYLRGAIAAAKSQWDHVIEVAQEIAESVYFSRSSRRCEAVSLLHIDGLLGRGLPADTELASELVHELADRDRVQSVLGWSDCTALALARCAARRRDSASGRLLARALNIIEANAHRTPLAADQAFHKLARAAEEVGAEKIRLRALARRDYFRALRAAAAGAAWGGEPALSGFRA